MSLSESDGAVHALLVDLRLRTTSWVRRALGAPRGVPQLWFYAAPQPLLGPSSSQLHNYGPRL